MNNLINCIAQEREFNLKHQLDQELEYLMRFPSQITQLHMSTLSKIMNKRAYLNYLDQVEESNIIQILIKGLLLKRYDSLQELVEIIDLKICNDKYHLNLLYYLLLIALYKQKKNQSQIMNKYINQLESESKSIIPQLLNLTLDQQFVQFLVRCIQLNPTLFRTYQRQLQEYAIKHQFPTLFTILQWTYLDAKQGAHSYANQIQHAIIQLVDAYYIINSLLELDNDKVQLYQTWSQNVMSEEFKSNLQALYQKYHLVDVTVNQKTKFSIYFSIIKDLLSTCLDQGTQTICQEELKQLNQFVLNLIQCHFSNIKEEIIIELPLQDIIYRIQEILNMNVAYTNYFDQHNQHSVIVQQQLQNKLSKLQIDRKIELNLEQFKDINLYTKIKSINLIQSMIESPFSEGLRIHNALLNKLFSQLLEQQSTQYSDIIVAISQAIKQMNYQSFLCNRLQAQIQYCAIELLEQQFPKFLKEFVQFKKQEKMSVFKTVQDNKNKRVPNSKGKVNKEYSLGLNSGMRINIQDCKAKRKLLENWIVVLSQQIEFNLRLYIDDNLTSRQYQLIYTILSFPFEQIIQSCSTSLLLALMELFANIIDNYTSSEQCIIQPIQYFIAYLENTEEYSQDIKLQQLTTKILTATNQCRSNKTHIIVDNHYSIIKALNEQYQKALLQQSDDQFYSCKENEGVEIEDVSKVNQIKKVKSLLVGEESSQKVMKDTDKSDEMFFSIQQQPSNPNILSDNNNIILQQQLQEKDKIQMDDIENDMDMPKAVFD